MEKNIKILKILIEENYISFDIKNLLKDELKITLNNKDFILNDNLNLKITKDEYEEFCEKYLDNFKIDINDIKGFGGNSYVETKNGPIKIKEIEKDRLILDSDGKEILVKNVIIFKISNNDNQIVKIQKSNCGINLPYDELIMSIKNNLKIKKIILKGRSLFLNGKASLYFNEDNILLYNIETNQKKNYLINGFIVESI